MKWLICLLVLPLAACASAGDVTELQDQISDLNNRVEELEAASETLHEENDDLKKQLNNQAERINLAVRQISALATCASAIQEDIDDLTVLSGFVTIETDRFGTVIDGIEVEAGNSHMLGCE